MTFVYRFWYKLIIIIIIIIISNSISTNIIIVIITFRALFFMTFLVLLPLLYMFQFVGLLFIHFLSCAVSVVNQHINSKELIYITITVIIMHKKSIHLIAKTV